MVHWNTAELVSVLKWLIRVTQRHSCLILEKWHLGDKWPKVADLAIHHEHSCSDVCHDQISGRLQLIRKAFIEAASNTEALHWQQHSCLSKGKVSKRCRCSTSLGVWLRCSFGINSPNSPKVLLFFKHQQPCLILPKCKCLLCKDARHT